MPILDVEIVTRPNESLPDGLARQLADIAGEVLEGHPGGTWVKLRHLPREQYAENGELPETVHPVFVSVLMGQQPEQEAMQQQAEKLADALAVVCSRSKENVHILFQPSAAGRIAFGGKLFTIQ